MVGPPDRRPLLPPSDRAGSAGNRLGGSQQPLGSTSTFARIPDGISVPGRNGQAISEPPSMSIAEYQRAQYQQEQQRQQQVEMARGNLLSNSREPTTSRGQTGFDDLRGRAPSAVDPGAGDRFAQNPATGQQGFDPRLSQAEIARLPFGAWSFDAYGNPIDREGRIVDQYGRLVSQQRAYELTSGRTNSQGSLQRPAGELARTQLGNPDPGLASQSFDRRAASTDFSYQRLAQQQVEAAVVPDRGSNVVSLSDRGQGSFRSDSVQPPSLSNRTTGQQKVTAQPIFNGLLLLSIIANFYLIHHLSSLRLRFRELVAAKCASGSEIAA